MQRKAKHVTKKMEIMYNMKLIRMTVLLYARLCIEKVVIER